MNFTTPDLYKTNQTWAEFGVHAGIIDMSFYYYASLPRLFFLNTSKLR